MSQLAAVPRTNRLGRTSPSTLIVDIDSEAAYAPHPVAQGAATVPRSSGYSPPMSILTAPPPLAPETVTALLTW